MIRARHFLAVAFLFLSLSCGHADQEFYQYFLSVIKTNDSRVRPLTLPRLIDSNNIVLRLTNQIVNLSASKTNGKIGDIRLGMSMDEIVAAWGKPNHLWSRCYGGG